MWRYISRSVRLWTHHEKIYSHIWVPFLPISHTKASRTLQNLFYWFIVLPVYIVPSLHTRHATEFSLPYQLGSNVALIKELGHACHYLSICSGVARGGGRGPCPPPKTKKTGARVPFAPPPQDYLENINFHGFEEISYGKPKKSLACGAMFLDTADIKDFLVWFWSILGFSGIFSLTNLEIFAPAAHILSWPTDTQNLPPPPRFSFSYASFNKPFISNKLRPAPATVFRKS